MAALLEVLDLERIEEDLYRGGATRTSLQRTFGGQVAAQALVSATSTVPAGFAVHSLHAYFVRPGDTLVPTVYSVDRVRDGRSFMTRRVTAVQHGRVIFTMSASFSLPDDGPEHQAVAPAAPQPEVLQDAPPDDLVFQEVHRHEWPDWDVLRVPAPAGACQQVWLRHRTPLPDDPVLHACALAYASDMTLLGCARRPHEQAPLQLASLDHAVWFLRSFRADDWLLYDQTSPSAGGGRGLSQGSIFDRSGRLVASVVQEGLLRHTR
jgi:acyl-CoA thioesterase-2